MISQKLQDLQNSSQHHTWSWKFQVKPLFQATKQRVKQHRQMLKTCRLLICLWLRCAGWKVVDNGGGGVDALSGTASTIYAMPCKHLNGNVYRIF